MSHKPEWIKLGEVLSLASQRANIGASKMKIMLREDAATTQPVVKSRLFDGCKHKRYGRASVCRLLQIPEA